MPKNWKSLPDPGVTLTLPAHQTCHHRTFRMTCEQYEELIAESESECMACAKPAAENGSGKLVIDHDYSYGRWAVRGLICSRCNSLFGDALRGPYWAMPYLSNPWFLRETARRGLSPEVSEEPSRDKCFRDFDGHIWFFEEGHWQHAFSRSRLLSWRELFYEFGPWLTSVDPIELTQTRGYQSLLRRRAHRAERRRKGLVRMPEIIEGPTNRQALPWLE